MKFGFRTPSFKKSFAARTSWKRMLMPRMPRGYGFLRNPKKALYNKIYNRTTVSITKAFTTKSKPTRKNYSYAEPVNQSIVLGTPCTNCSGTITVDLKRLYKKVLLIIFVATLFSFAISNTVGLIMICVFVLSIFIFKPTNSFYCRTCQKGFNT